MAGLSELQAYRSRLLEARYSGERRVRDSDGSEVEYRSDAELRAALAALDAEIARAQRAPRVSYPATSKGV